MWTIEELQDMAVYDDLIDEMPWGPADEAAEESIREQLLPDLLRRLDYLQIDTPVKSRTVYKKETRYGKGNRKSKGNVEAQRARRSARQKLKKQILEEL